MGSLEATSLVNGDVDENRTRLHRSDHLITHQVRRTGTRNQHRTDHQVGILDGLAHRQARRVLGSDAAAEGLLDVAHSCHVDVEDRHSSAHAFSNTSCAQPSSTTTEDDDLSRSNARGTTQQRSIATSRLHQAVRTHLGRQTASNLRHRGKQRQGVVIHLHRLVGDGGDAAIQQLMSQLLIGSQVKVREQQQSVMHPSVLFSNGLLDLENHLRGVPHFIS